MREILPGIHHWTAFHEGIRQPVSSHYVAPARSLIDPMVPEEGLRWLDEIAPAPEQILLSNRHHFRHSQRFVDALGCPVRCSRPGLHEFEGGAQVEAFDFGDELAPGITALEVGVICPDETAFHIALGEGALLFADGLIRPAEAPLCFVPDFLMGDDPEGVKRGLRESFRRLLDRDFDHLLFAHGEPLVGGGMTALREFAAGPSGG